MERPTPVSSLLHSSTIVVAGVYLMILVSVTISILAVILLLGMSIVRQMDVKKNIAYSTSIHLVVIALLSLNSMYSVVVVYIILHRIIKGQLFQSSGYEIHRVGSQDIRKFSMGSRLFMMFFAMIILSALVGMVIMGAKELVVLGLLSVIIVFIVCVSMSYTMSYLNKVSSFVKCGENEGFYVLVLMLCSLIVVDVNFNV